MSLFEEQLRSRSSLGAGVLSDDRAQIAANVPSPVRRFWLYWAQAESYRRQRNWTRAMWWVESAGDDGPLLDARRLPRAEFHGLAGLLLYEVGEIGEAIPHLSEASRRWEEIADEMASLEVGDGPRLIDEILDQYEGLGGTPDGGQSDDRRRLTLMEAWIQDRFLIGRHQVERARVVALGTAVGLQAAEDAAHAWEARLERSVAPPSRGFFLEGLWMDLGNVAQANGEFEPAANHFERARELVEPIDDQHRLQALYLEFNRTNALAQAGSSEAEASFAELEQRFRELGDHSAALRCEHAQIYQAWRRGDGAAERRLRENLARQEQLIGETQDPENLHTSKQNLEKGYLLLLSILAQQPDGELERRLREVLRLVAALREPAVLARLAPVEEPGSAGGIEAADALDERLRHLDGTVLVIVESGEGGLVWVAVQGGEGDLAGRVAIEQAPVDHVQALVDLLRRAEAESDAVSAGAVSPTGTDSEALVLAARQAWESVPASVRGLVSSSGTVLYSPSAFGVVDQLPLELLHTDQNWLGLSHVIARFPSISHLERALAPNATPRSLGKAALVARAQDPADLGRLQSGDNDARRVNRALGFLGLESRLAFSPSAREFLDACGGENQVVHYVGHGLAGELGEALPLGNDEVTVAGLAELLEHQTPFVFLSACFVGRGRHLSGGKQRGIGFELLERGAPGVVAATYSVPDRVCNDVALAFYQHSLAHPVGEAMRLARRQLAEAAHLRAVCWSSFSVYGDPSIVLGAGAVRDLSGSRARTVDAPALLARWLATGRQRDLETSLDAWTAWAGSSAELQEWLRASPRPALSEQERGALVDGLVAEAPVHAAALRMLLARERVAEGSLSGDLSGEAAKRRLREIGRAVGLSLQLDDDWAFAALSADYRRHSFWAVDLGESIAVMGKAEAVLDALSRHDDAFEEPLQATRELLEPLRGGSMVMDARRMLGLSHEEFQAVEDAPGSELAKRALLKAMAHTGQHAQLRWPWWTAMTRYVATNSTQAYAELAASVAEEDPAQGGISPAEAELVRAVLRSYQGPGHIDADVLRALRDQVAGRPEALRALDVFEVHDRIASDPEAVADRDVASGAALATELGHAGLRTYFLALAAQLDYQAGRISTADEQLREVVTALEGLAGEDEAYGEQLAKARANGAIFAALNGDLVTARELARTLDDSQRATFAEQLPSLLQEPPAFPASDDALDDEAARLLETGSTVEAMEWYLEADKRAAASGDLSRRCGLLGDLAVAFRRVGNRERARTVYAKAIETCRGCGEDRNLSAWASNLGNLALEDEEVEGAERLFLESRDAAERSGDLQKRALAANDLGRLFEHTGKHRRAADEFAAGLELAAGDEWLTGLLRRNGAVNLAAWARQLLEERDLPSAAARLDDALALLGGGTGDDADLALDFAMQLTRFREAMGDAGGVRIALEQAVVAANRLGDTELEGRLREALGRVHDRDLDEPDHGLEEPDRDRVPTVAGLRAMHDAGLDEALTAWRSAGPGPADAGAPAAHGTVARMHHYAQAVGWHEAAERLARVPEPGAIGPVSAGGPAGLVHLASLAAGSDLPRPRLLAVAAALEISDDDLACVVLYALQDDELAESGGAIQLLQIAFELVEDAALAGRLGRILGMYAAVAGRQEAAYGILTQADDRLEGGVDPDLRAEIRNERAVCLSGMGRFDEAIGIATSARELALAAGVPRIAAMAAGNVGHALMQLRRFEEAIAIFEPLLEEQRDLGDDAGAEATRFNLRACRVGLGQGSGQDFDVDSDDPDELTNAATQLALSGDYRRAFPVFDRALELGRSRAVAWHGEGGLLVNYARALVSAGQLDNALARMDEAVAFFERVGDDQNKQTAQSWIADVRRVGTKLGRRRTLRSLWRRKPHV